LAAPSAGTKARPHYDRISLYGFYPVSRSVVLSWWDFLFTSSNRLPRCIKAYSMVEDGSCSCRAFIRTGGIGNGVTAAGISTTAGRRRPRVLWPFLQRSKVNVHTPDPSRKRLLTPCNGILPGGAALLLYIMCLSDQR